jgi:hypothetical protein
MFRQTLQDGDCSPPLREALGMAALRCGCSHMEEWSQIFGAGNAFPLPFLRIIFSLVSRMNRENSSSGLAKLARMIRQLDGVVAGLSKVRALNEKTALRACAKSH